MDVHRTELRPASSGGCADWLRRVLIRSAPRARVIAPPVVRLGEALDVEWRLENRPPETTLITVSLVGTEIARRRISARTGISVVAEARSFLVLELDRRAPERDATTASGRGATVVPARTVPTLAGKLNEIAWAVIVEASFQASTILRQEFPLAVLAVAH
jgi:hypothetical protein